LICDKCKTPKETGNDYNQHPGVIDRPPLLGALLVPPGAQLFRLQCLHILQEESFFQPCKPKHSPLCFLEQGHLLLCVKSYRSPATACTSTVSPLSPSHWLPEHRARGGQTAGLYNYLRHSSESLLEQSLSIPGALLTRGCISVTAVWPAKITHDQFNQGVFWKRSYLGFANTSHQILGYSCWLRSTQLKVLSSK
jgi:hypothetical protein